MQSLKPISKLFKKKKFHTRQYPLVEKWAEGVKKTIYGGEKKTDYLAYERHSRYSKLLVTREEQFKTRYPFTPTLPSRFPKLDHGSLGEVKEPQEAFCTTGENLALGIPLLSLYLT